MKSHSGPRKPRLRLYGLNPDIFHYILQYIYTDKIDPNFDLRRNIMDLYVAADYVQLPELNAMIKEYLYTSVNTNDVSRYIRWANKYGHRYRAQGMETLILREIRPMVETLEVVPESSFRG